MKNKGNSSLWSSAGRPPRSLSVVGIGVAFVKRCLCVAVALFLCGCSSQEVVVDGRWLLESESEYLSMRFGADGYVSISQGDLNGPHIAPVLKWDYDKGVLRVFDEGEGTLRELSGLYLEDGKIYGVNKNGSKEVYQYTPPDE